MDGFFFLINGLHSYENQFSKVSVSWFFFFLDAAALQLSSLGWSRIPCSGGGPWRQGWLCSFHGLLQHVKVFLWSGKLPTGEIMLL